MTSEEALNFIEAKLQLACQHIESEPQRYNIERMFGVVIEEIKQNKSATIRRVGKLDKQLDVMLRVIGFSFQNIDPILKARFGVAHLSEDPVKVIKKVMARGSIRGDSEGEIVREFVNNVDNEDIICTEAYNRLASILENWEVGGLS